MTFTKLILALACLISGALMAQEPKVTQLLSKDLTNLPGKEGLMITVEYPPGGSDPIHRHKAHGFIYVLKGSIVMQVRGGKEVYYPDLPHGLTATHADQVNAQLLAFFQGVAAAAAQ